ncbi:cytochrome P450 2C42-like [Antechinus flavipes]|uniref:cytochrome P450 2C42-like n=1 Tax=Antechinus flavipes TaxID=38775 RepID=UPI00223570B4|nr:cytochrome P450 2C42-like [Antechinus flavipes]
MAELKKLHKFNRSLQLNPFVKLGDNRPHMVTELPRILVIIPVFIPAAKIHEEIDRVIGHNRAPSIKDRQDMPYMDAVVHEVQRFANIIPLNLSHAMTRDIQLQQYFLPKGTTIFPLLFPILFDSQKFLNPQQFDPQHFLDKNGKFKKSDYFMPFSIGKRSCVGEGLARMELFLLFTTILQNFTLKSVRDPNEISIKTKEVGFTNIPPFYELCFLPR